MMILAVFRSRAQSMDYAQRLNDYGVAAMLINTPKEAKIGCGLCVRFDARDFFRARAIFRTGRYTAFKGFYKMEYVGGRLTVAPYTPIM